MEDKKKDICDDLEATQAMVAFMGEASAALLKAETGVLPGKAILWGMAIVYSQIETRLEDTINQVQALSA